LLKYTKDEEERLLGSPFPEDVQTGAGSAATHENKRGAKKNVCKES
jgi:hypothetical protein